MHTTKTTTNERTDSSAAQYTQSHPAQDPLTNYLQRYRLPNTHHMAGVADANH